MAEINKPYDVNIIWSADSSAVSVPNVTPAFNNQRIKNGWTAEIPPLEDFNFLDKRQDTYNAYVNQHGVVEWDEYTEYRANKSFVQVSGIIYKAAKTSKNTNPVGDTTGSWSVAFTTPGDLSSAISSLQAQINSSYSIRGKQYFTGQF